MFRTPQKYLWRKSSCGDRLHPYGNIITSTIQVQRSIVLTSCRYKTANINSRNYYELLGIERTATQKEIKNAFFKLSKEYHPDSNSADKSLHEKFVKINEAFTILSKQPTRTIYDQSLNSISRPYPRQPPPDWPNVAYQRPWNPGSPYEDPFRRRMDQSYYYSSPNGFQNNYFAPISIVLIIIGVGMFFHALQTRISRFSDPQYAINPRSRHYFAYREWQRLSALKDAESLPIRRESSLSSIEEK